MKCLGQNTHYLFQDEEAMALKSAWKGAISSQVKA